MEELLNGGPKKLPAIIVGWDEANQRPVMQFDTTVFKSWQMVLMILEVARQEAEFNLKTNWAANAQAKAQQAAQDEHMRRRIMGG